MEVKIGVQNVAREITLESDESPEQVSETVRQALADGGLLSLTDEKGRLVLVPGCTHSVLWEATDRVRQLIVDFVREPAKEDA